MREKMDFNAIAERIIRVEVLTFALASLAGNQDDLAYAREALKKAIIDALAKAGGHNPERPLANDCQRCGDT